MRKHPMQKVAVDDQGTVRFVANPIVEMLLEGGPYDMNKLAIMNFSDEDRAQFAQLIGYSVCGFHELPYVSDKAYSKSERRADKAMRKAPDGERAGEEKEKETK